NLPSCTLKAWAPHNLKITALVKHARNWALNCILEKELSRKPFTIWGILFDVTIVTYTPANVLKPISKGHRCPLNLLEDGVHCP
ncbi:hypothetical protein NDU88_001581, partial [Pleurodeles waltl]